MEKQSIVNLLKEGEEIVISGVSGRFPEADTIDEFADNLFNKVDMITVDDRRWPTDIYDMNQSMGKLKDISKFDGAFFGIMSHLADTVDPHSRILLETTYEAICDAGINPQNIRGSKTGVYIGYSSIGMPDGIPEELQHDSRTSLTESMLWVSGTSKAMYANRISFVFDFRGPSMTIDTACSSSMVALDVAITDLRLGKCQQAIVGGTNINLQPFSNHIYQMVRFNSAEGKSKVWDEDADGFVRGETVCCLFLQHKPDAKRIYATVLHSRTNIDGNKKTGMFFPSSECQRDLLVQTYKEANVNPLDVTYFEAHGTGTKAGDLQEAKAIYNAYCNGRKDLLPIGLLKSNIGHGEGASGVASVVKVLIAFENDCIPANLNLKKLKSEIAEMSPPLFPVNDSLPYKPGIAGVNSFGVGGVNGHVLLEPNYKRIDSNSFKIVDQIPRLVNICARTEDSLKQCFDFIENNKDKVTKEFLALITDVMNVKPSLNSSGFPFRGSMIIKKSKENNQQSAYHYTRQSSILMGSSSKEVWFFFSGIGSQWPAMAKALMQIDIFASKVEECAQILKPYDIDLKHLLLSEDSKTMTDLTHKFVATTAMQIALVEVLRSLNITPDGIIGHSFGEIACAYVDNCLTTNEALLTSYWRGKVLQNDSEMPKGLMAAIGLSWDETRKLCPKGIYAVCNNSKDSVTISGPYNETKKFIETLTEKSIFVREIDSSEVALHTPYLNNSANNLIQILEKIIPNPKERSKKWITTSFKDSNLTEGKAKYASAQYFIDNLLNPVYFHNSLIKLPSNAIIIEVSPHSLFEKIIGKTLENANYIPLVKRNQNNDNLDTFIASIGKLYQLGVNVSIDRLYPKVEWPVGRNIQSISSLIKWDHKDSFTVKKFPQFHCKSSASDMTFSISLSNPEDKYLMDHCIDGRYIFPATGYLMLAWRRLAAHYCKQWTQLPVVFEDVQFRRPTFLSTTETTKLTVRLLEPTGEFLILESNNITSYGRIYTPEKEQNTLHVQHLLNNKNVDNNYDYDYESITLDASDVYKELRVRGYNYGPKFRGVHEMRNDGIFTVYGKIKWTGSWVSFMDSLLQATIANLPLRGLFVPVRISSLRCDPKVFFDAIEESKLIIYDENEDNSQKEIDLEKEAKELTNKTNIELSAEDKELIDESNELRQQIQSDLQHFEQLSGTADEKSISVVPMFFDLDLKLIVTKGLEVSGWNAAPIPRKAVTKGLKLDSYGFIANEENDAIEDYHKKELIDYIQVCCFLVSKVLKNFGINESKFMNGYTKVSQEVAQNYLINIKENHIMLKIFENILNSFVDENKNSIIDLEENKLNHLITEILKNPSFDLSKDIINQVSKNERLIRPLLDIVYENNVQKKDIKIHEINLSNAIMAIEVDNHMASSSIYPLIINYTLVNKSIDGLPEDMKNANFQLVEWDSYKSAFPSELPIADLIVMRDSYDLWALNLETYLQNIYNTIANKGFLLSVFRYKWTTPERVLNQIYEQKYFNDSKLEQRINEFAVEAQKIGFNIICRKSDSIGSIAILFRKVSQINEQIIKNQEIIEINNNYEEWFEILKHKINEKKANDEPNSNIWLVANDSFINGIIGLTLCLRQEPGGDKIRCIFDCDQKLQFPLDFTKKPFSDILVNDLAFNVVLNDKLGTYRHISLSKINNKVDSNDYYLNYAQRGDLSSLQWFHSKTLCSTETFSINADLRLNQVKCHVYYSGLNFRDVMIASGRVIPGVESTVTDCIIGTEFSGRRSDTGERVFGFALGRAIGTSVDSREDLMSRIPDNWSMEEAVTLLTTYFTVWYGLIERAQLRQNESILIHSGAGGVGQAAIAVCQYFKCDVFTTVGNEEKKQFLMSRYGLPEDRVFSSRDTQFEYELMSLTKGKGVDIVLNSLIGDKLQASFRCVADDGRFVEIGKYDLQMSKQMSMFSFLRNISFHGIAIERPINLKPEVMKSFFNWIQLNSTNGCVKPLNTLVFESSEASHAFRYMTSGKHIGKIVIKIRDEEPIKSPLKQYNPTVKMSATLKSFFNPKKVYIIIGGLGGFGLELTHWMTFNGAKKIVLTSRTGIRYNYQRVILNRIKEFGDKYEMLKTQISVSTIDANTIEGAKHLLEETNKLGPIGGIFHLAVVLNDAFFDNQTIDTFRQTCDSKINSFINLDKLTRLSYPELDYFVGFSSVSCGKGNAGQTNYGFANSVVERICELRRRDGLHGLAIQWGPIGDVGLLADNELTTLSAFMQQRIASCLEVFDTFLQSPNAILSSVVRSDRQTQKGSFEDTLMTQLWSALGVDPKTLPDEVTLGELGMESMFAVEFQQNLEREYDIKMTLSDIKNISVKQLKQFQSGGNQRMKNISNDIKKARIKLLKFKFIIPDETHTMLNEIQNGDPIYLLPPLEGIFSSFEELIAKLKRPVIGLNWTQHLNSFNSIKDISRYYIDLLNQLSPNGNYDIVGHSFGSLILAKMLKKAPIGRAVIIDTISQTVIHEDNNEEVLFESIYQFVSQNMPEIFREKVLRDLKGIKTGDQKVKKVISDLKEFGGKGLIDRDIEQIFENTIERGKLGFNYRRHLSKKIKQFSVESIKKYKQINAKLLVIKPIEDSNDNHFIHRINESFYFQKLVFDEKLNIETINANPDEILSKNTDEISYLINKYLI